MAVLARAGKYYNRRHLGRNKAVCLAAIGGALFPGNIKINTVSAINYVAGFVLIVAIF